MKWVRRTGMNKVVGRIYIMSPSEGKRFYLCILLNNIRGPRSFEELMTMNDIMCPTFKEAAEHRRLLQHDAYVRHARSMFYKNVILITKIICLNSGFLSTDASLRTLE